MNLFNVLNQGKSRLHEPSMSAMLGYLLTPTGDHGLSDTFLRSFILMCQHLLGNDESFEDILKKDFIDANVDLEVQYSYEDKRKDIDIQLSVIDKTKSKEIHRIIIENKIKTNAANPRQLSDYYTAVINDDDFKIDNPTLTIVFLTPKSNNSSLQAEYDNLQKIISKNHRSLWLYWTTLEEKDSVVWLIKDILIKESSSDINPINEYMKHTLKAFVRHVKTVASFQDQRQMRTGEDIGNIIEEVVILTKDNKKHRIVRRDSTQIQVFDDVTGEKKVARHIMSQYIDENNIDIPHEQLNTRSIGKKLLDQIREN